MRCYPVVNTIHGFVRSLGSRISDWLPRGPGDVFLQLGLFVLADLCYETVRGIAEGQKTEAFANGNAVIDVEQATGTFFEADLQSALLPYDWIIDSANFMYMNSHFVLTTGFLVWLYLRHNENFYFVRNMFLVAMALALIGYTLVPTAPPRFYEELGFVDTLDQVSRQP